MKYIIFEYEDGNYSLPIIFPERENHFDIAKGIQSTLGSKPISAGFVKVSVNENMESTFYCYGESVTLKLHAREKDSDILTRMIS